MTEAEWLACNDPRLMLAFVIHKGSERKLRLLACAAIRRGILLRSCVVAESRMSCVGFDGDDYSANKIPRSVLTSSYRDSIGAALYEGTTSVCR